MLKAKIQLYRDACYDIGFDPKNYNDGIYDISVDDYWTYYRYKTRNRRPKFSRTTSVKFLKNSEVLMFVSISPNGSACILQGGQLRKIEKPLQYYYDRMPEYSNLILQKFSKYWNELYKISNQLKSVVPDKENLKNTLYAEHIQFCECGGYEPNDFEKWYELNKRTVCFNGRVHGCIVDLDYRNHIYLNPYDGTVVPYSAPSMYMKYVYKNVTSLISAKRPELLKPFQEAIALSPDESKTLITENASETHSLIALSDEEIDLYNIPVTDVSMYEISNRMNSLQSIYDFGLIEVWYDNVLPHYELEKMSSAFERDDFIMDSGDVQFEDSTIVEERRCKKSSERKLRKPNSLKIEQKNTERKGFVCRTNGCYELWS